MAGAKKNPWRKNIFESLDYSMKVREAAFSYGAAMLY